MSTPLPGRRRAFRFVNGALAAPTTPLTGVVTPIVTTPTTATGDLAGVVTVAIDTAKANVQLPNVPHFTVELGATSGPYDGLTIDLEAWQSNVKIGQATVSGKGVRVGSKTYVELDMPGLPAGTYDLTVLIFNDPLPNTYAFGTQRYAATNIKQFTLAAAPVYQKIASNPTGIFRAPQVVDQYIPSNPDLAVLGDNPQGIWLGNDIGTPDPATRVGPLVTAAAGARLLFIVYSIVGRDAGNYSAGGLNTVAEYKAWIDKLAAVVGTAPATYVIEPDAIGLLNNLDSTKQAERLDMLRYASNKLGANANAKCYIDAGHPGWMDANQMASRLNQLLTATSDFDGFSVNVSNYRPLAECITWSASVSSQFANKKAIIDTSRNGKGTAGSEWCNPAGQGVGRKPTLTTGQSHVDAFLWLKAIGESDGNCNGGPSAGTFWLSRAKELVANAVYA